MRHSRLPDRRLPGRRGAAGACCCEAMEARVMLAGGPPSGSQGMGADNFAAANYLLDPAPAPARVTGTISVLGDYPPSSLISQVYLDLDDDGSFDVGEPRATHDPAAGPGGYLLKDLAPGTYKVRFLVDWEYEVNWPLVQTLPAGPGGHEGYSVTVGPGEVAAGRNFNAFAAPAGVSGVAFDDRNRNGADAPDPGESPVLARVVYVDADNDGVLDPDERRQKCYFNYGDGRVQPYDFWLKPGTYTIRQVLPEGWTQSFPPGGAGQVVTVTGAGYITGRNLASHMIAPYEVVARHAFYNHSSYDGNDALPNAADDAAVAPDKAALLPGQPATFANVTSYAGGINGVMVDVRGVPEVFLRRLGPADFQFATSDGAAPAGAAEPVWAAAPAPASLTLRRGAGSEGTDRITLVWPDNAIKNTWLRVTVLANERTGLARPDVFYFGSLAGDTGDGAAGAPFRVGALDIAALKRAANTGSTLAGRFDFNRDGSVNALDLAAARSQVNRTLLSLTAAAGAFPAALFALPGDFGSDKALRPAEQLL